MLDENIIAFFNKFFSSHKLTKKQTHVAFLMLHGFTNKQIAITLKSNTHAIKQMITVIFAKTETKHRSQFLAYCYMTILNEYKMPEIAEISEELLRLPQGLIPN